MGNLPSNLYTPTEKRSLAIIIRFCLDYARAVLLGFLALFALDWLAYTLFGWWLPWLGVVVLAAVWPGIGFLITMDEW